MNGISKVFSIIRYSIFKNTEKKEASLKGDGSPANFILFLRDILKRVPKTNRIQY
jgi:hypothetical protein